MNKSLLKIWHNPYRNTVMATIAGFTAGFIVGRRNRIVARTVPDQIPWIGPWGEIEVSSDAYSKTGKIYDEIVMKPVMRDTDVEVRVTREEQETLEETYSEGWVWETELAGRDEDGFYILHKDEFYRDERDYTQTTLTYYQGDDILVDQESVPVYNYFHIVGDLQFGHGSDSDTVFFVRNCKLKAEYEIVLDDGKYSVEILGLDAEVETEEDTGLKHSRHFREE